MPYRLAAESHSRMLVRMLVDGSEPSLGPEIAYRLPRTKRFSLESLGDRRQGLV